MASTNRFAGDIVLITGGTAGIGAAIADAFVAAGASVAVCARSQSGLDAFARRHPDTLTIRADVADAAGRTEILDAVARRFGKLDILVKNAGLLVERDFAQGPGAANDPCAGPGPWAK
ncbi:MAG: SDR family NAD(P)-dependent oxidoreductase, partial [Sphingomonas sp.]